MNENYNPNSVDSKLTELLVEIRDVKYGQTRIEDAFRRTEYKVAKLEREKWMHRGFSLAGLCSAIVHAAEKLFH